VNGMKPDAHGKQQRALCNAVFPSRRQSAMHIHNQQQEQRLAMCEHRRYQYQNDSMLIADVACSSQTL